MGMQVELNCGVYPLNTNTGELSDTDKEFTVSVSRDGFSKKFHNDIKADIDGLPVSLDITLLYARRHHLYPIEINGYSYNKQYVDRMIGLIETAVRMVNVGIDVDINETE